VEAGCGVVGGSRSVDFAISVFAVLISPSLVIVEALSKTLGSRYSRTEAYLDAENPHPELRRREADAQPELLGQGALRGNLPLPSAEDGIGVCNVRYPTLHNEVMQGLLVLLRRRILLKKGLCSCAPVLASQHKVMIAEYAYASRT
jgi:hypothetical protein